MTRYDFAVAFAALVASLALLVIILCGGCRPEDNAGQPVPDFGGRLGAVSPDMARDLSPPPIDVAFGGL